MNTKLCTKCYLEKNYEEFHNNSKSKDGHDAWCKDCKREYQTNRNNRDISAFLGTIYNHMVSRCKTLATYEGKLKITREKFLEWGIPALQEFIIKNDIDTSGGYRNKGISIDKIEDGAGYIIGNLQFLSVRDNAIKGGCTPKTILGVSQFSLDGKHIKDYDTMQEAADSLPGHKYRGRSGGIHKVVLGQQKTAYGYIWKYKEDVKGDK